MTVTEQERERDVSQAEKLIRLVKDCQKDLAQYLPPDSGVTKDEVIARLLERLDGPQAREALNEEDERIRKWIR